MDLPDFLLARIAEDEAVARAAIGAPFDLSDGIWTDPDAARQMRRWDPARVLAEWEAKRRIVDYTESFDPERRAGRQMAYALRLLALPYADHPDYREEWRP